ncbi:hypothetical protein A0J61_11360 [Choanephora cucurbitarum]|uniref:Uncharacterized protein n=1 Tax=Choanephora cucurbitarum TaxID=101091 RepID=A0A1C7MUQ2_9FUNG|nr:hypothetical protein A0J61_11360 [Choanephora cucurbitarum]
MELDNEVCTETSPTEIISTFSPGSPVLDEYTMVPLATANGPLPTSPPSPIQHTINITTDTAPIKHG